MTDHRGFLGQYRHLRQVRLRLNQRLVETIPKATLDECGRILGISQEGVLVFETEDEMSLLMDYCLYYPLPDGRNLVAKYLETSPPTADSDEMAVLQAMTHAYYSLFQVVDVERGVGVSVRDLLREEPGFIVDVGFGNSAEPHMMLATRILPMADFLCTGGAALPLDATTASRTIEALARTRYIPEQFDFKQITPRQEAEFAAIIIRECRSTGMTSRITYAQPGGRARSASVGPEVRRIGRNDPCPCGSGRKYKKCCGRPWA